MDDNVFDAGSEQGKDRNFVTALARGLDVLRCFRPNETDLTNQDFAERTGLPRPTISRLTHTLCKLDYLVLDERTGSYRLGAGVLSLGFGVLSGMEIGERAASEMRALRNGPNSYITCALGECHRLDVVYVAVQRSREDVSLTMHVGSRLPLFFSAIGRSILVGMTDGDRAQVLELACETDPDLASSYREGCDTALRDYDRLGYCTGYGDWREDVNGIAVPVSCLSGSRVYGLNVGGPSFHVKKEELEDVYAERLIAAAQALSMHP